jgi:hypothetical protein
MISYSFRPTLLCFCVERGGGAGRYIRASLSDAFRVRVYRNDPAGWWHLVGSGRAPSLGLPLQLRRGSARVEGSVGENAGGNALVFGS